MKKYLLLRNNHRSGPHTIEQLAFLGLFPLDLIWIEDESLAWKHAEEVEELREFINYDQCRNAFAADKTISTPTSSDEGKELGTERDSLLQEKLTTHEFSHFHHKKEPTEKKAEPNPHKSNQSKSLLRYSPAIKVAAVFIGIALSAFMLKKIADEFAHGFSGQTSAVPVIDCEIEKHPPDYIRNALVTEIVPLYKSFPEKALKSGDIKKQLKIKTNDYKVGMLGGIHGLRLTVLNQSIQLVDELIVSLDYLRSDGSVVESENVSFSSIKPLSIQTIAIPGPHHGVKVKYKIVKVHARDFKADTREA